MQIANHEARAFAGREVVEFEPERAPALLGLAQIELDLPALLDGRTVDLRTPEDLSLLFPDRVTTAAEVQYGG